LITRIDTLGTANALVLQTVANVDANGTDLDTQLAVNAVAELDVATDIFCLTLP
jgi:hypothetical protein